MPSLSTVPVEIQERIIGFLVGKELHRSRSTRMTLVAVALAGNRTLTELALAKLYSQTVVVLSDYRDDKGHLEAIEKSAGREWRRYCDYVRTVVLTPHHKKKEDWDVIHQSCGRINHVVYYEDGYDGRGLPSTVTRLTVGSVEKDIIPPHVKVSVDKNQVHESQRSIIE